MGRCLIKKLQQFYILKFNSERLKKSNFDINITIDQAKSNAEVVSINTSELLRALFRLKKQNFDQNEIDNLLKTQKRLKKAQNSEENRIKLREIIEKIEKILYVEDLVSIEFNNKAHYLAILKRKGFYINGIRFVPFMASAGMIRRNTALFINNNLKHPLMDTLENGRDEKVPIVPAKWGAYFSLYSSTSLPVSFPSFAVVPDKEIETIRTVDFVSYRGIGKDDEVSTTKRIIKANAWDGQGLISPDLAKRWSEELELDYTFSCAVIRAPFIKGLVATFDFEKFANLVAKKYTFTDIYGNEQDIRNIDLIISESMFKLYSSYPNAKVYVEKCFDNKLGFSVTKVNPKRENTYSRTSYQFLQILDLNDADISDLCKPTVDWFRDIQGESADNMLLYALGETNFDIGSFSKMDLSVKAVAINKKLARDRYIHNRFNSTIDKKKKESYMGSILINANYQFMVSDPYYQACHIFGLDCEPLLKENEHYADYWLNLGINKVGAIRSPIVHHSEFNILNFKDTDETRFWYQHIKSGIIFPTNGVGMDCAIHGGADFDGDLICTINNPTMIKGKQEGIPIIYDSLKAEKKIIDSRNDAEQIESQLNGYNSKVGFATNVSSSLYAFLEEFPEGSPERETILNRLKIGRVIQGEIIDGVKGLKVPPFRDHWTKRQKIDKDMSAEEAQEAEFNNKIVCAKRPQFFRFLYPHYMTRYRKELERYDIYCHLKFGKSFEDILKSERTTEEEKLTVENYKKYSYFLDNNSVMNQISHTMRDLVRRVNKYSTKTSREFDYTLLINAEIPIEDEKLAQMEEYMFEYQEFKQILRNNLPSQYGTIDAFAAYLRKKAYTSISSNESELANYAVMVTYGGKITMVEFPWRVFPEGIMENIIKNSSDPIMIPFPDDSGDIEYLWQKYKYVEVPLGAFYENE